MNIKEQISQLVEEKIASTGSFLVDVKVSPGRISVSVDHPEGIKIEECVAINRFLHERLETTDLFDKHELEVGSPGMEEPLKVLPQFRKRIGQPVSVVTFDGMKHTGKLLGADDTALEIEEETSTGHGKKKEVQKKLNRILFNNIKETRVVFSFDKII